MNTDILSKVKGITADILGTEASEINLRSEFLADLNASLEEMAEIIKKVEEEFDIELEYDDIVEDIPTLAHLMQLIEEAQI